MFNKREVKAFNKLKSKLETEYNELYDAMYHYIRLYLKASNPPRRYSSMNTVFEMVLYKDEIENLIGINEHEKIVDYILWEV